MRFVSSISPSIISPRLRRRCRFARTVTAVKESSCKGFKLVILHSIEMEITVFETS